MPTSAVIVVQIFPMWSDKMNWRAALQSADDASDEAIMLGQMAFVMETIIAELKKPKPDIPMLLEMVEENLQTTIEELMEELKWVGFMF